VSRLEGGLVAELKEPDRDVKRAVLERLLTQQGANPEAAADRLSQPIAPTDSVRSLVGMLQRVVSAAAAQDGPLSAGLAREVLEGQSARDTRRSSGFRTSGLVVSSLGGIKSREKVVWDWADVADRYDRGVSADGHQGLAQGSVAPPTSLIGRESRSPLSS